MAYFAQVTTSTWLQYHKEKRVSWPTNNYIQAMLGCAYDSPKVASFYIKPQLMKG